MYVSACMPRSTCEGQRQFSGVGFSFYHVDPRDQIQVLRLGSKHLLSHLISPSRQSFEKLLLQPTLPATCSEFYFLPCPLHLKSPKIMYQSDTVNLVLKTQDANCNSKVQAAYHKHKVRQDKDQNG